MGEHWEQGWRSPTSSLTRVLRSPAFCVAREQAGHVVESPGQIRALLHRVESLGQRGVQLSAVADRVAAAVSLLRATADRLDAPAAGGSAAGEPVAGVAARERLVVAGLIYLVTVDDLVPDLRVGGYLDDVLLLTWVFGAAVAELEPHLPAEDGDADGRRPVPS